MGPQGAGRRKKASPTKVRPTGHRQQGPSSLREANNLGLFRRRHPLDNVENKYLDTISAFNRFASKPGPHSGDPERYMKPLAGCLSSIKFPIEREKSLSKIYGFLSLAGVDDINRRFQRFLSGLGEMEERLRSTDLQLANRLRRVIDRALKLHDAIIELGNNVRVGRVMAVPEHGSCPDEYLKLKEAISKVDRESAAELTAREVDRWSQWPGIDTGDPQQVRRLARLILLLKQEPVQTFEVRCRSRALGRPLLLMGYASGFPSEEEVQWFASSWKEPGAIYVAVTKPSWRIVWIFQPGDWEALEAEP